LGAADVLSRVVVVPLLAFVDPVLRWLWAFPVGTAGISV
jgi:hypothetical protein